MAFKDTGNTLKKIIGDLSHDLEKAMKGNKAASQRVRTGTIKLAKIAKLYRKESVATEKSGSGKGKATTKTKSKKGIHLKKTAPKTRRK